MRRNAIRSGFRDIAFVEQRQIIGQTLVGRLQTVFQGFFLPNLACRLVLALSGAGVQIGGAHRLSSQTFDYLLMARNLHVYRFRQICGSLWNYHRPAHTVGATDAGTVFAGEGGVRLLTLAIVSKACAATRSRFAVVFGP